MIKLTFDDLAVCVLAVQNGMVSGSTLAENLLEGYHSGQSTFDDLLVERELISTEKLRALRHEIEATDASREVVFQSLAGLAPLNGLAAGFAESLHGAASPSANTPETRVSAGTTPEAATADSPSPDLPDSNRYTPINQHAQGGLGTVFRAKDEELGREVALKQIRDDYVSNQNVRSRFLFEARITGHLEHPGIVPVYGLTVDAEGKPAYAMRFIEGRNLKETLNEFHRQEGSISSSDKQLAFRKLINRLITVCYTLHFAHNQNVIHRDLKPENIMLGSYDETLVVDWGIARLMDRPDESDKAGEENRQGIDAPGFSNIKTRQGSTIGTPGYMSPEQALGWNDTLTPASDIFSIGVILYTVLAGSPPYQAAKSFEDFQTRVLTGDHLPVREVNRQVPAALACICEKAMAQKPAVRYATAEAMARDLESWLADEPVSAMPESMLTRLSRTFRKNKSMVVSILGAALTISVISVATTLLVNQQRQIADSEKDKALRLVIEKEELIREKEILAEKESLARQDAENLAARAQRVVDYMVGVFQSPDIVQNDSTEIKVKDVLDNAMAALEFDLEDQPLEKAAMYDALLGSYHGMGMSTKATEAARLALRFSYEGGFEDDDPEVLDRMVHYAFCLQNEGRYAEAIDVYEQRMELSADRDAETLSKFGRCYYFHGDIDNALQVWEEAYDRSVVEYGADAEMSIIILNNLAMAWSRNRDYEKAVEAYEDCLEGVTEIFGPDHVQTLSVLNNLSTTLMRMEQFDEAGRHLERILEIETKELGEQHPSTVGTMINLAGVYSETAQYQRAYDLLEESLEATRTNPDLASQHLYSTTNFAGLNLIGGQNQMAQNLYEEAIELVYDLSWQHVSREVVPIGLVMSAFAAGNADEAEDACRDYLIEIANSDGQAGDRDIAMLSLAMGHILIARDEIRGARTILNEVDSSLPENPAVVEPVLYGIRLQLEALISLAEEDVEKAQDLCQRGHALIKSDIYADLDHLHVRLSLERLIRIARAADDEAAAKSAAGELEAFNAQRAFDFLAD
ncbi:MAG: serine/threonine-protein kinase [Planctomycetota bacterium]